MSVQRCSNCGNPMGCSCQKRVTADGRQGCTNCINQLNANTPPAQQTVVLPKTT